MFNPLSSQDLEDLGFTLLESNNGVEIYSFPDNLDHGGYKLALQDPPKGDPVATGKIYHVIDPNGIWQPETVPDVSHLYFFMERFPKK